MTEISELSVQIQKPPQENKDIHGYMCMTVDGEQGAGDPPVVASTCSWYKLYPKQFFLPAPDLQLF